jgi:predicted nucleic acid-binding protein
LTLPYADSGGRWKYIWDNPGITGTVGQPIGNNDLWIATHAKAAGLTIVTSNEREFRRIPGLKVQNWVA